MWFLGQIKQSRLRDFWKSRVVSFIHGVRTFNSAPLPWDDPGQMKTPVVRMAWGRGWVRRPPFILCWLSLFFKVPHLVWVRVHSSWVPASCLNLCSYLTHHPLMKAQRCFESLTKAILDPWAGPTGPTGPELRSRVPKWPYSVSSVSVCVFKCPSLSFIESTLVMSVPVCTSTSIVCGLFIY